MKVFYTWGESVLENKYDPGFNKAIQWDLPLLEGYEYEFLQNTARKKGSHHFRGIVNPDIIKRVNAFAPDAILVYGWSFHSHLKVLRAFHKKIPLLFRGDSTLLGKRKSWKQLARRIFLTWVYKKIDFALYPGKRNYEYYLHADVPRHKLIYAPHAIDNRRFEEANEARLDQAIQLKKNLSVSEHAFVFLFAAKLDDNKNTDFLIKSFLELNISSDCHLIIVGNGIMEEMLKEKYRDKKQVHFMSFQNQERMPVIYRMANVFVLPSKSETWGLAVNEAMACGCAILMSEQSGAAIDLVHQGKNGYTFNAFDSIDLKEKLLLMATNPKKVEEMGNESRKIIRDFSFEKIAEPIEVLMQQIMQRKET